MIEKRREASRARFGVSHSNRTLDEVNKKLLHNLECEKAGAPLPYNWVELHNEAESARAQFSETVNEISDDVAVLVKDLFEDWNPQKEYSEGERFLYNGNLYRCKKKNPVNPTWTPDVVHEYYEPVAKPTENGTSDKPITAVAGMEYEIGKYYSENGKVYLCERQGMNAGDKITLYYLPSALVGHYFKEVDDDA